VKKYPLIPPRFFPLLIIITLYIWPFFTHAERGISTLGLLTVSSQANGVSANGTAVTGITSSNPFSGPPDGAIRFGSLGGFVWNENSGPLNLGNLTGGSNLQSFWD
jgi:hypothetical protein